MRRISGIILSLRFAGLPYIFELKRIAILHPVKDQRQGFLAFKLFRSPHPESRPKAAFEHCDAEEGKLLEDHRLLMAAEIAQLLLIMASPLPVNKNLPRVGSRVNAAD